MLVSELMLQQTQAVRIARRYQDFLDEFPTPAACAAASAGVVVAHWHGLGYNRRALHLHRAATTIVERHDGTVPESLDQLLALPGIGPYTARAVLAFAFQRDHGVLDTNAGRVLARAVAGRSLRRAEAQSLADELVPTGEAWAWNQAVLDLGATVCVKDQPRCTICPLRRSCAWQRAGAPEPDPAQDSAGASRRQSRFAGSDRQGRGRLVDAIRTGALDMERIPDAAGWPDDPDRAKRVADTLVSDGLAEYADGQLSLPS